MQCDITRKYSVPVTPPERLNLRLRQPPGSKWLRPRMGNIQAWIIELSKDIHRRRF